MPNILPNEFAAIFAMGANFFSQGHYKKAQIIFRGLMALDAHDYRASIAYGESLLLDGQASKAASHFLKATKLFPTSYKTSLGGARACILLERYAEAREFLRPILKGQLKVSPEISQEIAALMARI